MNRALSLVPKPKPTARKPTYALWPIINCGMAIDRRADWQAKYDAEQAKHNRTLALAQSRAIGSP